MAVLVGGLGYIGSQVALDLLRRGEQVVGLDNLFSTDPMAIRRLIDEHGLDFVEGNVTSARTIAKAFRRAPIDTIYWTAAQASANPQAASPHYTETTNLRGPRLMLDAAREFGVKTVVFASSLKVYGPYLSGTVDETTPYGVFSDMAHLSHCYVEKLLEMYASMYGLKCVPVRLGIVYGLGPVVKTDYRFMTAPNKFCLQAVRDEDLTITAAGWRIQGFIHVADAAQAMLLAAKYEAPEAYAPVNAATELVAPRKIALMVKYEAEQIGHKIKVINPDTTGLEEGSASLGSKLTEYILVGKHNLKSTIQEMLPYFASIEQAEVRS